MLIQVDVDSTLYDADPLFERYAKEAGINWPSKSNCWLPATELAFTDGSPCNLEALKKVFRKTHSAEVVKDNVPYPDAATTLARIARDVENAKIVYVSDRNEQQTKALYDWLQANGFLYSDDQHVFATKDKRDWMRANRPSIVIDDRVRTILLARYELQADVIALEQPHNINLKGEAEGIWVAKDWKQIDAILWNELIPKYDNAHRVQETPTKVLV